MKNSKLNAFKMNEVKSIENEEANLITGGAKAGSTQSCYEPTGSAEDPDMLVEKWPDEGGAVSSFTYRTL